MRGTWHGLSLGGGMMVGVLVVAACAGGEKKPAAGADSTAAAPPAAQTASTPSAVVYVSDERGNKVTVVDVEHDSVVETIDAGQRPRGVRLTPDGKTLMRRGERVAERRAGRGRIEVAAADRSKDGIALIDLSTDRVRRLQGGIDPETFEITSDGKILYVSNEDAGTATALDLSDGKSVAVVKIGSEPEGVQVTPDNKVLYATNEGSGTVTVLDLATNKMIATIEVGSVRAGDLHAGRKEGVRAREVGGDVTIVDVKTHKVLKNIDLPKTTPAPSRWDRRCRRTESSSTSRRGGARRWR